MWFLLRSQNWDSFQRYRDAGSRQYRGDPLEYQDAHSQQVYQNSQQQKPYQPTVLVVQGNPVAPGNSTGNGECLSTIQVRTILEANVKLERVVPESHLMALINSAVSEKTREVAERMSKEIEDQFEKKAETLQKFLDVARQVMNLPPSVQHYVKETYFPMGKYVEPKPEDLPSNQKLVFMSRRKQLIVRLIINGKATCECLIETGAKRTCATLDFV